MELITLCGLVVVVFGLWVEFDLAVKAVTKIIRNSKLKDVFANSAVRNPVYVGRMSICLAKPSHY
jgi:hypothetical protein